MAAAANSGLASAPSRRGLAAAAPLHDRPATPPTGVRSGPDGSASPSAPSPRRKLPSALRAARAAAISAASSTSSLEELQNAPFNAPSSPGGAAASRDSAPSPRLSALHAEKSRLRYRVVEQRRAFFSAQAEAAEVARQERAREDDEIRRGLRPPRIVDSRTLATPSTKRGAARAADSGTNTSSSSDRREDVGLKIYDAVAEGGSGDVDQFSSRRRGSDRRASGAHITDAGQNAAMDQFGALLDEYLTRTCSFCRRTPRSVSSRSGRGLIVPRVCVRKNVCSLLRVPNETVQDHASPSYLAGSRPVASSSRSHHMPVEQLPASRSRTHSPAVSSDEESDYVYDVYYRATDAAPKGVTQVPGAAGSVAGSATGWDVSSLAGLDRIGQLYVVFRQIRPRTPAFFSLVLGGLRDSLRPLR